MDPRIWFSVGTLRIHAQSSRDPSAEGWRALVRQGHGTVCVSFQPPASYALMDLFKIHTIRPNERPWYQQRPIGC
jgi:hypothetical protein